MTTSAGYNHTLKLFQNQEINKSTIKAMLRTGTTYQATDTTLADLDGSEVSGNGWTAGGETLTLSITTVNTDDSSLDFTDVVVTATGGSIGPAGECIIYDDTNDNLLYYIDFEGNQTAGVGTDFRVNAPSGGLDVISRA